MASTVHPRPRLAAPTPRYPRLVGLALMFAAAACTQTDEDNPSSSTGGTTSTGVGGGGMPAPYDASRPDVGASGDASATGGTGGTAGEGAAGGGAGSGYEQEDAAADESDARPGDIDDAAACEVADGDATCEAGGAGGAP